MEGQSRMYSALVVGEEPDKVMSLYDMSVEVEPYVKYKYLSASKYKDLSVKAITKLLDERDKIGISKSITEAMRERLSQLTKMSSFDYYKELTDGLMYDKNGNALTTENPKGKWMTSHIGRNFSNPFILKDGTESYSAKKGDIDWDRMVNEKKELYGRAWDLVIDKVEPTSDVDFRIVRSMSKNPSYFSRFKTREEYVSYNTDYWNYAFVTKDTWKDVDDDSMPKGNEVWWINNFFNEFILPLDDNETLSIFECSVR